jgi:lipopolysaccharide biosynthesis regulator YciM
VDRLPEEVAVMTFVPDSSSEGIESAVDILANVVEHGGSVQAICTLASLYRELGEHEKALRYASLAVEREPS